jgi:hypothetical protein
MMKVRRFKVVGFWNADEEFLPASYPFIEELLENAKRVKLSNEELEKLDEVYIGTDLIRRGLRQSFMVEWEGKKLLLITTRNKKEGTVLTLD